MSVGIRSGVNRMQIRKLLGTSSRYGRTQPLRTSSVQEVRSAAIPSTCSPSTRTASHSTHLKDMRKGTKVNEPSRRARA